MSLIGGFAYPNNIPPFWNHKDFFRLTYARTENIKENAQYLYDKLKLVFGEDKLILPNHKLFVIYQLDKDIDYKLINSYIDDFVMHNKDLELYASDSFGFDYFAVNLYFVDMEACPSVRFSVGDVPKEHCKRITKRIKNFITELRNLE